MGLPSVFLRVHVLVPLGKVCPSNDTLPRFSIPANSSNMALISSAENPMVSIAFYYSITVMVDY